MRFRFLGQKIKKPFPNVLTQIAQKLASYKTQIRIRIQKIC
jgi:hypothetical protein